MTLSFRQCAAASSFLGLFYGVTASQPFFIILLVCLASFCRETHKLLIPNWLVIIGRLRTYDSVRPPYFFRPRSRSLRTSSIVTQMIEALSHGGVLRRPARLSHTAAKDEAVRAVLAYLHA
jgi:hypothetical protein